MRINKILITGGHLTPAVALIDKLRTSGRKIDIVFVGRRYALDSEQTLSLEYKEITKRGVMFIPLQAGRITRIASMRSLFNILKIPAGFLQAFFIISRERPTTIFSFGGYIALPIAFAGWVFNIPVYTHEQTIAPGLANKWIGFFSKKIFYSFPEAGALFPQRKAIFSGNPVRAHIFHTQSKPFEIPKTHPVIYVTGGSLGSHGINMKIKDIVHELLQDYTVIHQTGDVKEYNDYEYLMRYRRSLPDALKNRYFIVHHFYDEEIGYIYAHTDLIVGRAGANTFFEAIHLKKPTVFIPLPWSSHKEQDLHAAFFSKYHIGETVEQKESSSRLLEVIHAVMRARQTYQKNFRNIPFQIKQDATDVIIKTIFKD